MNRDLERRIDRALARRDFLEANRLMSLRRVGDDDPLCKGGQGRSADDVERDGGMVLILVCAAICGAVAWMFVDGAIALFGGGQ